MVQGWLIALTTKFSFDLLWARVEELCPRWHVPLLQGRASHCVKGRKDDKRQALKAQGLTKGLVFLVPTNAVVRQLFGRPGFPDNIWRVPLSRRFVQSQFGTRSADAT